MNTFSLERHPVLRACLGLLLFAATLLMVFVETADARGRGGVQRMAIRPGTYHVPHGGGGGGGNPTVVPAFCLDREAESPGPGDVFSTLGGDPASIRVGLGNEAMSLGSAMARGLIRIRGSSMVEYIRSPLTPGGVVDNEVEKFLPDMFGGVNSHRSLVIENLDPQKRPMTLEVGQPTFLGTDAQAHPHLAGSDVAQAQQMALKSGGQLDEQQAIWALETLRKLGYGNAGEDPNQLGRAVSRFQHEYRINVSGQMDLATAEALKTQDDVAQLLREANEVAGDHYRVVHVNRRRGGSGEPSGGLYRVQSGADKPKFVDDPRAIIELTNTIGAGTTGNTVYLLMDEGSTEAQRHALEISLSRLRRNVTTRLVALDQRDATELLTTIAGHARLSEIGSATRTAAGFHGQHVSLGRELPTLAIQSRDRSLLVRFIAKLRSVLEWMTGGSAEVSYMAAIHEARRQLAKDLGKSLDEVDREIQVNVGNTQVAGEEQFPVPALAWLGSR